MPRGRGRHSSRQRGLLIRPTLQGGSQARLQGYWVTSMVLLQTEGEGESDIPSDIELETEGGQVCHRGLVESDSQSSILKDQQEDRE